MLAPMFEEVVALDLTEQMLEKAKVFIKQNGHENVSFVGKCREFTICRPFF